jgi:predicted RNA binding protein YcfA (HicA-like mRNA interferase family)
MSARSFESIVSSGARVSKRELFAALRAQGCEVIATSKPSHFKVRHPGGVVIIATRRDDVLPVYVSRIARELGLREGGTRE